MSKVRSLTWPELAWLKSHDSLRKEEYEYDCHDNDSAPENLLVRRVFPLDLSHNFASLFSVAESASNSLRYTCAYFRNA